MDAQFFGVIRVMFMRNEMNQENKNDLNTSICK